MIFPVLLENNASRVDLSAKSSILLRKHWRFCVLRNIQKPMISIKNGNQTYFIIYNNFIVFAENDEFMEIQPDDSKKVQQHMKRHWFYKAWRIRAAPDQKSYFLQKK